MCMCVKKKGKRKRKWERKTAQNRIVVPFIGSCPASYLPC